MMIHIHLKLEMVTNLKKQNSPIHQENRYEKISFKEEKNSEITVETDHSDSILYFLTNSEGKP